VAICVAGASNTVRSFLEKHGGGYVLFESDSDAALDTLEKVTEALADGAVESATESDTDRPDEAAETPVATSAEGEASSAADAKSAPEQVGDDAPAKMDADTDLDEKLHEISPLPDLSATNVAAHDGAPGLNGELRKKLVQYRSLLSLNSDFSRINDKSRLLDAFLLTTIAQVGVESAVFLEHNGEHFRPEAWKGFETANPDSLAISADDVNVSDFLGKVRVYPIMESPLAEPAKHKLQNWEMYYVAPFIGYGQVRALVLLGKPLRKNLDEDGLEFLLLIINQAAVAYENSCRFQEESDRTLGLVQTLISMIEENTLSRGTTELVVLYTTSVAHALHYPEEHMRDLMYGTVLRDIGMVKVSDLIVRSPRELHKDEWEIIKKHPTDGVEMLKGMRFSQHTTDIVLCHHERFNGDGYPNRVQGDQIPLGARIVSVVESYAAMLQDRPTRPALTEEEALSALKENWGLRYDPVIVEKFAEIVEEDIRSGNEAGLKQADIFKI
jgi:hypothetical protein